MHGTDADSLPGVRSRRKRIDFISSKGSEHPLLDFYLLRAWVGRRNSLTAVCPAR